MEAKKQLQGDEGMLLGVPVRGVTAAAADASPAGSYMLTAVVGGEGS